MPRVIPKDGLATVYPVRSEERDPPGERAAQAAREDQWLDKLAATRSDPYHPAGPFSYYRDLLTLAAADRRRQGTIDQPRFALGDSGPEPGEVAPGTFGTPQDAQRRRSRALRDLTSATGSVPDLLRPLMPGRLAEIFDKAARRVSGFADALERVPLEAGMLDNSGSQMVVKIPALATGAGVATAAENAAVQETDPTSAAIMSPLGTIAGQVDSSRQVLDFSQPGIDDVISDDLRARIAEALDAQLFNGTGAAGTLKGSCRPSACWRARRGTARLSGRTTSSHSIRAATPGCRRASPIPSRISSQAASSSSRTRLSTSAQGRMKTTHSSSSGRCARCRRAYEQKRGTAGQRGYGATWRRLAAEAKRIHPYCSVPGCTSRDLTVDHIDPTTKGRRDLTLADVQVLCRSHNSAKGRNNLRAPIAARPGPAPINLSVGLGGQTCVL